VMRLIHKLILGFLTVVFLSSISGYLAIDHSKEILRYTFIESTESLALNILGGIENDIHNKVEFFQEYSLDSFLQKTVSRSNQDFEKMDNLQTYISNKDKEWTSKPENGVSPFIENLINNDLSEALRKKAGFYEKHYGYNVFNEIFVTNKYGANVAQTGRTSDYRQDDEEWWQQAKETGLYIANIKYDDSAEVYSMDIAISVTDERGEFQGVLKVVLSAEEILRLVQNAHKGEDHEFHDYTLITREARLISSSYGDHEFMEDLSQEDYVQRSTGEKGRFVGRGPSPEGDEELFVFARLASYREFKGFDWTLIIGHQIDAIFCQVSALKQKILAFSLFVTAFAILICIFAIRHISGPILKLREAAAAIGKGKLGVKVDFHSNDELGGLAVAFNTMSQDLMETTVSRDLLSEEVGKRKIAEEEKDQLIKDLQVALNKVKILSGIVPICMYCKQIRDDKGYWNQLEQFISEHSEAQFSHSICDKCMKENHPGVEVDEDQKS
ncbi:MAG: HAMP domain-containing protein, partial [Candidatus Heimdallarchaeota archaeon]|nr:HAMP domain-containing protein [Candidatus Heimdallarchaeota archaeon]